MTATNLMNKASYNVLNHKGVLYIETGDKTLPYIILEPTNEFEENIEEGQMYMYYKIGELLYSSFATNNVECFVKERKKTVQQRLF